jgi:hypothetical protein
MTSKKERKRKGRQVFYTIGKAGPNSGKAHGLGLLPLHPRPDSGRQVRPKPGSESRPKDDEEDVD